MTICNMSIEAGARAGMIAPDETTFAYLEGRAARAAGRATGTPRSTYWRTLRTDDDADFDAEVVLDADALDAVRHLGHQPRPGRAAVGARCPTRTTFADAERARRRRAGAGVHGPDGRARRCATSPSTRSSSAPAPTAGSRTCGPPPTCCAGRTGRRRRADAGRARARCGCALQAEAGGPGRGLHRRRRRVAARPAARCAWA